MDEIQQLYNNPLKTKKLKNENALFNWEYIWYVSVCIYIVKHGHSFIL